MPELHALVHKQLEKLKIKIRRERDRRQAIIELTESSSTNHHSYSTDDQREHSRQQSISSTWFHLRPRSRDQLIQQLEEMGADLIERLCQYEEAIEYSNKEGDLDKKQEGIPNIHMMPGPGDLAAKYENSQTYTAVPEIENSNNVSGEAARLDPPTPRFHVPDLSDWGSVLYSPELGHLVIRNECRQVILEFGGTRYNAILRLLPKVHDMLCTNAQRTLRDVYYTDVAFFRSQVVVNEAFNDLSCILRVPRWNLNCVN